MINASESLTFANGLTTNDEPDLWDKDLTGAIALWIMVGLPDEKLIKKALGRSNKVVVYSYGGSAADIWWSSISEERKFSNLSVINISQVESLLLANLAERSMKIQASIQDGIIWLSSKDTTLEINQNMLKKA